MSTYPTNKEYINSLYAFLCTVKDEVKVTSYTPFSSFSVIKFEGVPGYAILNKDGRWIYRPFSYNTDITYTYRPDTFGKILIEYKNKNKGG